MARTLLMIALLFLATASASFNFDAASDLFGDGWSGLSSSSSSSPTSTGEQPALLTLPTDSIKRGKSSGSKLLLQGSSNLQQLNIRAPASYLQFDGTVKSGVKLPNITFASSGRDPQGVSIELLLQPSAQMINATLSSSSSSAVEAALFSAVIQPRSSFLAVMCRPQGFRIVVGAQQLLVNVGGFADAATRWTHLVISMSIPTPSSLLTKVFVNGNEYQETLLSTLSASSLSSLPQTWTSIALGTVVAVQPKPSSTAVAITGFISKFSRFMGGVAALRIYPSSLDEAAAQSLYQLGSAFDNDRLLWNPKLPLVATAVRDYNFVQPGTVRGAELLDMSDSTGASSAVINNPMHGAFVTDCSTPKFVNPIFLPVADVDFEQRRLRQSSSSSSPSSESELQDLLVVKQRLLSSLVVDQSRCVPLQTNADTLISSASASKFNSSSGLWTDINMNSQSVTNWEPDVHLTRTTTLATAAYFNEPRYSAQALSALRAFLQLKPRSSNWLDL